MPVDETHLLYSICLHGRADLGLAPDEYAALTMVLLRLLAFKPSAEKKTLTRAEPRPAPAASLAAAATPAASTPVPAPLATPVVPLERPRSTVVVTPTAPPKPRAVQPWEDDAAPPVPAAVPALPRVEAPAPVPVAPAGELPAGQMLGVLDSDPRAEQTGDEDEAPAQDHVLLVQPITRVLAMPVRQQAESRVDMALSPVAPVLIPDEEGDFWFATVQQLVAAEAISAIVRELALQSQLVARDTDQWLLRVERETLNQSSSRERLTTALRTAGFDVTLAVEIGRVTDCPARRNAAASDEKQRAAEKIILDDPFVQTMMRDYGAKIVPGSLKPL
jgi:DNA polymerase-3 subunit gamma/tau